MVRPTNGSLVVVKLHTTRPNEYVYIAPIQNSDIAVRKMGEMVSVIKNRGGKTGQWFGQVAPIEVAWWDQICTEVTNCPDAVKLLKNAR